MLVTVVADLHYHDKDAFWTVCDHKSWTHPTTTPTACASTSTTSRNPSTPWWTTPNRSLAGELRRAGGFAKDTTPFSEFLWADFLRRNIKEKRIENDFSSALGRAMSLAKSKDADYLPGWCGPVTRHVR